MVDGTSGGGVERGGLQVEMLQWCERLILGRETKGLERK